MFIIGTALYSALTIIFVPALIVLAYMMATNSKYNGVINVYGISGSGIGGLIWTGIISYIFLSGLCAGELPVIWKSTLFLIELGCSIVIAVIICRILRFMNRDRIKYAEIILADEEIQEKIVTNSQYLEELQKTMNSSAYTPEAREINKERIASLRETINKLSQIHNELQEQKIIMNAAIGSVGVKNVLLSSNSAVNKKLDRELGRFNINRYIDSNKRDVHDIMSKYKI